MIRTVQVENCKSISTLTLDLGRITVLIGANGSGKSNILEAIALASAAAQNKLDNEFLTSRGIRVTETRFMRTAFDSRPKSGGDIKISIRGENEVDFSCQLSADETATYPRWKRLRALNPTSLSDFLSLATAEFPQTWQHIPKNVARLESLFSSEDLERFEAVLAPEALNRLLARTSGALPGFLVYSPENSALRTFQAEGQILPLGIRGEGLFAHLKALNSKKYKKQLSKIKEELALIDWFEGFDIPEDLSPGERSIRIRDRYLPDDALFDQRSANEGFLFLLFYITLFVSPDTPAFFAIDNVDASLNPKLCSTLLQRLTVLAKEYDKQVIFTTHNPAVLDGLDLHDEEQRLLVVDRTKAGHTRVHRLEPAQPVAGQPPVSLSEAFLRGYIGGLPKNF